MEAIGIEARTLKTLFRHAKHQITRLRGRFRPLLTDAPIMRSFYELRTNDAYDISDFE
jgi:hypothetical protein